MQPSHTTFHASCRIGGAQRTTPPNDDLSQVIHTKSVYVGSSAGDAMQQRRRRGEGGGMPRCCACAACFTMCSNFAQSQGKAVRWWMQKEGAVFVCVRTSLSVMPLPFTKLYGKTSANLYSKAFSQHMQAKKAFETAADTYFMANDAASYDDWKRARAHWNYFC